MDDKISMKNVVNHIVHGTFAESLCLVCLSPLGQYYEDIFNKVSKDNTECCVATVLEAMYNLQLDEDAGYSVCADCFIGALSAYKFHLQVKNSQDILNYYMEELSKSLDAFDDSMSLENKLLCISLPIYETKTAHFDIDLGIFTDSYIKNIVRDKMDDQGINSAAPKEKPDVVDKEAYVKNDDVIIIKDESQQQKYYSVDENGDFVELDRSNFESSNQIDDQGHRKKRKYNKSSKTRKKRSPMAYLKCSQCPIKYRFLSKLKQHMRNDHNIKLCICKICKTATDNEHDYYTHLHTHKNIYVCAHCDVPFKKRKTIIKHLYNNHVDGGPSSHVCEACGQLTRNELDLQRHCKEKHDKSNDMKFICFYCGKSYKAELSLEQHIKKHKEYTEKDLKYKCEECGKVFTYQNNYDMHVMRVHGTKKVKCRKCNEVFASQAMLKEHSKTHSNHHCEECGGAFVDARALMWHQRLHRDERPYACHECGRGFVSDNRRRQHLVCAHSAPARRCPLCPALFHLRSMVNSHVRKVHLKSPSQRRSRSSKYDEVFWKTEVVPIQELSVAIQHELLEMQTDHLSQQL